MRSQKEASRSRSTLLRDFLIFQLKLVIDGAKDVVLFQLSILAVVVDLLRGRRRNPGLFYRVLSVSERFDLWLNVHAAAEAAGEGEDGLFGASTAGSDTLVGKLEQMWRGGDEPRGRRPKGGDSGTAS
ncbi:MAG: hypothetical protein P8Z36_03340 [Gemmatimonadota bacterium]|jgi:hypothetical protein